MNNKDLALQNLIDLKSQCSAYQIAFSDHAASKLAFYHFQEKIEELLDLLSEEPAPIRSSPLTPRESEILKHVSNGFTNREIAQALSISEKTIEYHLSSVFRKLDVSSRTEAVTQAFKDKIL